MIAVRTHGALRDYEAEQLQALLDKDPRRDCVDTIEKDLAYLVRSLVKDKNLLLVDPYLFYVDSGAHLPLVDISNALYSDFHSVVAVRKDRYPDKETYLSFFHKGDFVVVQMNDDGAFIFDSVPISSSKAFMRILGFYDSLSYPYMDELLGR